MNVPRRPLYVSYEKLKEVLDIPDEIDIIKIKVIDNNAGVDGIELLLISAGEVDGVTKVWQGEGTNVRRIAVELLKEIKKGTRKDG